MRLKNKGFTLVELLAVIAILAIIATITVPTVINVLQDSRENAFKDNAMAISRAAQNYYASSSITKSVDLPLLVTFNDKKETNKYFNNTSNEWETSSERMLDYTGENPDSGNICINKTGQVSMAIYSENTSLCATKEPEDKTITTKETEPENCLITEDSCF